MLKMTQRRDGPTPIQLDSGKEVWLAMCRGMGMQESSLDISRTQSFTNIPVEGLLAQLERIVTL